MSDQLYTIELLSEISKRPLNEILDQRATGSVSSRVRGLWSDLLHTARAPAVTDRHLTAACNALCSVLRRATQYNASQVRGFAFSREPWFQAFGVAHKAFTSGKNKPGLQILGVLVQCAVDNEQQNVATEIVQEAATAMAEIVFTSEPCGQAKESIIALTYFVRHASHLFSFSQAITTALESSAPLFDSRCERFNVSLGQRKDQSNEPLRAFLLAVIFAINVAETRTAALKLFGYLCENDVSESGESVVALSGRVIEEYVSTNEASLTDFARDLLPTILPDEHRFFRFLAQYESHAYREVSKLSIFLALLEIGRSRGFLKEQDMILLTSKALHPSNQVGGSEVLNHDPFDNLLSSSWPVVRLHACKVLIAAPTATEVVSAGTLLCLVRCLPSLHDETDPYFRGEFIYVVKKLLDRLQRSMTSLEKANPPPSASQLSNLRNLYVSFMDKYARFLLFELSPHVSYQRRILALQIYGLFLERHYITKGVFAKSFGTTSSLIRCLLNMVLDPYDDVRSLAASLSRLILGHEGDKFLEVFAKARVVSQARKISAGTARGDHADAYGRILLVATLVREKLLPDGPVSHGSPVLQSTIHEVSEYLSSVPLLSPSAEFPLHGSLLGIMYCLQETTRFDDSPEVASMLFRICSRIWTLVQPHLCIDSPEVEVDEAEDVDSGGPKDLLAYSWRALRDSSLAMQAALRLECLTVDEYRAFGDLSFEQLSLLRHRGAFSTVAQTFAFCCQRARTSSDEEIRSLNGSWRCSAMEQITRQSGQLTRRSAGLPSIFAAVLDAKHQDEFASFINNLLSIARQPVEDGFDPETGSRPRLPQVHALNCIKDIMVNSKFRILSEVTVSDMVSLAASCIGSKTWAIRNCGLMLFRACITRLSSESTSPITSVDSTSPSTSLTSSASSPVDVALSLLDNAQVPSVRIESGADGRADCSDSKRTPEMVFAALDLLSRLAVHTSERGRVQRLIIGQLGSPIWSVREQAAHILPEQVSPEDARALLEILLPVDYSSYSINTIHGHLLACKSLLTRSLAHLHPILLRNLLPDIAERLRTCFTPEFLEVSALTAAASFDVVNETLVQCLQYIKPSTEHRYSLRASSLIEFSHFFLFRRAYALYQCITAVFLCDEQSATSLEPDLIDPDSAVYVFQKLLAVHTNGLASHFAQFVVFCTTKLRDERVFASGMTLLAHFLDNGDEVLQGQSLRCLEDSFNTKIPSRDLLNAQVNLYAKIFSSTLTVSDFAACEKINLRRDWFLRALWHLAMDVIETPTRMNAATALESVFRSENAVTEGAASFDQRQQLVLTLILWDLLNDDDDEVRDVSTNALKVLCVQTQHDSPPSVVANALTSRRRLAHHLHHCFQDFQPLKEFAIIKILSISLTDPLQDLQLAVAHHCKGNPVQLVIQEVFRKSSDLFAEEKQNLYIDEVDEVTFWSKFLHHKNPHQTSSVASESLLPWALNGITSLRGLLSPSSFGQEQGAPSDTQNLFGHTYNADFLVLIYRVVAIAEYACLFAQAAHVTGVTESRNTDVEVLVEALKEFKLACVNTDAHPCLLEILDNTVEHHRPLSSLPAPPV